VKVNKQRLLRKFEKNTQEKIYLLKLFQKLRWGDEEEWWRGCIQV
jgi:hypothetical protein